MNTLKKILVYLLNILCCFGCGLYHSTANINNDSIVNTNSQQACKYSNDTLSEELESTLIKLYKLGYRQMPPNMQANLLAGNRSALPFSFGEKGLGDEGFLSYFSLSDNTFSEIIQNTNLIAIGNITLDVLSHKISNINTTNNTNITDPIVFALSIDPLAAIFPDMSPYAAMDNDPINKIDPDGKATWTTIEKVYREGDDVPTYVHTLHFTGVVVDLNVSYNDPVPSVVANNVAESLQKDITDAINKSGAGGDVFIGGELVAKEEYVADIKLRGVTSMTEVTDADHIIYFVEKIVDPSGEPVAAGMAILGGGVAHLAAEGNDHTAQHEWGHLMSLAHTHYTNVMGNHMDPDPEVEEAMSYGSSFRKISSIFTPDQVLQMFDFAERENGKNPNRSGNYEQHIPIIDPEKLDHYTGRGSAGSGGQEPSE